MTILIKIEATKRDAVYELKRFMNSIGALWGQAFLIGRTPGFDACETLSTLDKQALRSKRIGWLAIGDGADTDLLNDNTLFPHLKRVRLCSERNNVEHLLLLAKNYPNIFSLTIKQRKQLSTEDVSPVKSFKQLSYLDLQCPHESDADFWAFLPKNIEFLQTDDCSPNLDLPRLTELRLNRCQVGVDFFETLTTVRLERLKSWRIDLRPGCLKALENISSLKELRLQDTNYEDEEIQSIRHLEYLSICTSRDDEHSTGFWERAEAYFQAGNYEDAEDNYKATVFDRPSAYGYLQIARCRLEMGDLDLARRYCRYAASIDPGEPTISLIESKIDFVEARLQNSNS